MAFHKSKKGMCCVGPVDPTFCTLSHKKSHLRDYNVSKDKDTNHWGDKSDHGCREVKIRDKTYDGVVDDYQEENNI